MRHQQQLFLVYIFTLLLAMLGICYGAARIVSITPSGWKISQPFDRRSAIVQSIEGNCKPVKYWESGCCGTDSSTYAIIHTFEELDSFWNSTLNILHLDKPKVDFKNNILIVVQPGEIRVQFKFKISLVETDTAIEIHVSNILLGNPYRALAWKPIMAFEFPAPAVLKRIKVQFDLDSRCCGMQPK